MPIDFPTNPTSGQTYSYNSITWEYNGVAWDKTSSGGATGSQGNTGATGATGPQGEPGQSSNYYNYKVHTTTQTPPTGNGEIRYNNATQTSSTLLYVDHLDDNGDDIDIFLSLLKQNDNLIIQDANNSNNYQTWKITSAPTVILNDYTTIPVTGITSAGTGTSGFANNHQVLFIVFSSPIATAYVESLRGLTGAIGLTNGNGIDLSVSGNTLTFSNTGVLSFNGLTGAVTGVTTGTANTFGPLQSFTSGISAAGGITFANDISVNSLTIGQGPVSGSSNTAIGELALASLQSGSSNTAVGSYALASATAGNNNVAIGDSAMNSTTNAGDNNVAIGSFALNSNAGGSDNLAIGNNALFENLSGQFNVAIGNDALDGNQTGNRNTAIGYSSLSAGDNTANSDNLAIGSSALLTLNSGNQNTAIGTFAGRRRGSGGSSLLSATGGIYIGYDARASADAQTNEIVIGNLAVGLGSNTAVIGRNTQTSATIYGLVNAPSGISAAGATLSANTIIPSGSTLTVNGNFVANGNVNLGDATTDSITVAGLLSANGGFSAAGATFSGLARFNAGISAAGGTFSGTQTFINGATFTGNISAPNIVNSVRGLTGAVGITNGSGIGLSVSGNTLTVSNTGVLSIDGGTGAITNVARTNVANTFTALQSFSSGISASGATFGNVVSIGNTGVYCAIKLSGSVIVFEGNNPIVIQNPAFTPLYVTDATSFNAIEIKPAQYEILFYDDSDGDTITLKADVQEGSGINPTVTIPNYTTTIAGLAGTQTFTGTNTFNTLTNFGAGISSAGGTFSALTRFTAGISAAGGMTLAGSFQGSTATFSGDIAVNGGDITTTSTTASLFNANATTLNLLNTQSSGFTLNIGTATSFSGAKNINIGGNISAGASENIRIGTSSSSCSVSIFGGITLGGSPAAPVRIAQMSEFVVGNQSTFSGLARFNAGISAAGGMTLAGSFQGSTATFSGLGSFNAGISSAGGTFSALTRFTAGISASGGMTLAGSFQGSTATFSGLGSFTSGISASGATFSAPITSTRMARHTSAAISAQQTADFSPTAADDGTVFYINYTGKGSVTVTLDGLPTGWRAKFLNVGSGAVYFITSTGDIYGEGSNNGLGLWLMEAICIDNNTYFVG